MPTVEDDVQAIEKTEVEIHEPGMFHVIFINDDYTPIDFVVEVLVKIFNKSENEAIQITMKIHNEGSGIAGTYVEDIARTKSEITKKAARENSFPLETKVEPA